MEINVISQTGQTHPVVPNEDLIQTIRVGVIGCGYWGPKLARNFHDLSGACLEAISDMRQDRLDEMKQLYPEAYTTHDHRDLLGDGIDAVVIATPVHTHYALAKEALLAGKHVFVEKPLASSSNQAIELVDIAVQKNLTLMSTRLSNWLTSQSRKTSP